MEKKNAPSQIDMLGIAGDMLATSTFWSPENTPFNAHLTPGNKRVILVTGDNGSGKSMLVQDLRAWCKKFHDVDATISISIRERTGSGYADPLMKSMVFGMEDQQSTGGLSVGVTQRAFNNLDMWSESGRHIAMVLDEPEIGLSQSYATPLGELIAKSFLALKSPTAGLVVVTHNRGLAKSLVEHLGEAPTFCFMGPEPVALDTWMGQSKVHSYEDLLKLPELCLERRRQVREFENSEQKPPRKAKAKV